MLISWKPKANDGQVAHILSMLGKKVVLPGLVESDGRGCSFVELMEGVYMIGHFNGGHMLPDNVFDPYPDEISCGSYGVCDSMANLMERTPELVTSEREFVVTMTRVRRTDQPESGGWRWHKWGEYIGTFDSQCEYLYDEVGIDEVFCYHVFEKVKVIEFADLQHGEYYGTSGMSSFFDGVRWDATSGKFKTFVYDDTHKEMVLTEFDYSPIWARHSKSTLFVPTRIYTDEVRRPVPLDGSPLLLE